MSIGAELKKKLWFAYFVALICWAINAYGLLFVWLGEGTFFARMIKGRPYICDFVNVYDAGVLGLRGRSCRIYDFNTQARLAEKTVAPIVPELPFYLQAPPIFFVCCIPLAFLSTGWAWALYCSVGLAACIWAVFALMKTTGGFESRFQKAFVLTAVLASFPAWVGIRLGNTSLFLFPCLTLFFLLLKAKHNFKAGLATALLMVKVQYLPVVGIIGLVLGRGRYLAGAVLAGLLVLLASVAVLGVENVLDWPKVLLGAETTVKYSGVEPENMQNIRGMLVAILHEDTSMGRITSAVLFLLSTVCIGFLWLLPYRELSKKATRSFELCAAISALTMIIFSIHTHSQDYLLMGFAGILLYASSFDKDLGIAEESMAGLRLALLCFPPLSWVFFIVKQTGLIPIQPFAAYAVFLLCYCLFLWFRDHPAPTAPERSELGPD